ncbi:hypothetical protein KUTeg_012360 [Tegillarca granosa]|uniref:Programmed cell death protein 10 dimerisation domain-containing protein n=1 Tax=Tegillarca granosa TaxID=220873 RepID=A0ABQ9F2V3_TEGGR|nr:hypothetical protein KUTeg_012360 [Tegillarca granosa]
MSFFFIIQHYNDKQRIDTTHRQRRMTMGENNKALYAKMIVDVVIGPVLEKLEKKDISAAQTLRSAFMKVDNTLSGFAYDYVRGLLRKGDMLEKIDMISRPEPTFQELNRCATGLKKILSRIPEQIFDRKQFLETIKEIASAIKRLLDAVNRVIAEVPTADNGSKQKSERVLKCKLPHIPDKCNSSYSQTRMLLKDC